MFFYLSKIVAPFTDPLAIVFVILLLAGVLVMAGRGRWGGRLLAFALAVMAIVMIAPVDYWILAPLENRFPIPAPPACLDGIVVLSGGEEPQESLRRGVPLLGGTPMRYVVLDELTHRYPAAKVIFSGGSGSLGTVVMTESGVAEKIMTALQFDMSRIRFEPNSRTTWENAAFAKDMATPKAEERWALLAPALQMPRAVGSFRKVGWDVLPWPTDFSSASPRWGSRSLSGRFAAVNAGLHQWLGLFAYDVTGRSSALFPAPTETAPAGDCASSAPTR